MGQTIEIWDADVVGDVMMVSTDRSLTGQDGESYQPGDAIGPDGNFPAQLAARLFASDAAVDHIYVMSNVLSVRRRGGWDDTSEAAAKSVITAFFNFYGATNEEPPAEGPATEGAEAAETDQSPEGDQSPEVDQ
jgi:hypothetical protein